MGTDCTHNPEADFERFTLRYSFCCGLSSMKKRLLSFTLPPCFYSAPWLLVSGFGGGAAHCLPLAAVLVPCLAQKDGVPFYVDWRWRSSESSFDVRRACSSAARTPMKRLVTLSPGHYATPTSTARLTRDRKSGVVLARRFCLVSRIASAVGIVSGATLLLFGEFDGRIGLAAARLL